VPVYTVHIYDKDYDLLRAQGKVPVWSNLKFLVIKALGVILILIFSYRYMDAYAVESG